MNEEQQRNIIDNYIIYWTSDDKEREQMRETLEVYLKEEANHE